jgi:hypothetical protein
VRRQGVECQERLNQAANTPFDVHHKCGVSDSICSIAIRIFIALLNCLFKKIHGAAVTCGKAGQQAHVSYRPAMSIRASESILIVDFSQVTQLIARRVRGPASIPKSLPSRRPKPPLPG